jgi:hypothetical protein
MWGLTKPILALAIMALCLFGFVILRQSNLFLASEKVFLLLEQPLLMCCAFLCGVSLFLTCNVKELPLIGLFLIAYFIGRKSHPALDVFVLMFGVMLGRVVRYMLRERVRMKNAEVNNVSTLVTHYPPLAIFLLSLVWLLTFASCCHVDKIGILYHGPRWLGMWYNPNDCGLSMAAGVTLSVGLLAAANPKEHKETEGGGLGGGIRESASSQKPAAYTQISSHIVAPTTSGIGKWHVAILLIAMVVMESALLLSFSRGAWVATAVGLIYLAKAYRKFKWRWVLAPVLIAVAVAWLFWNTPRTAPWYFQRLDLSRGSVQHRLVAWKAGFEIMRDHPFGVGWNGTVETYQEDYSAPRGGAAAITTNDYLMLGTQLGLPALFCFVAYIGLCFFSRELRISKSRPYLTLTHSLPTRSGDGITSGKATSLVTCHLSREASLRVACRAGALVCLVAFWFDGGLFKLATASVFWILLELGAERGAKIEDRKLKMEDSGKTAHRGDNSQSSMLVSDLCGFCALTRTKTE